MDIKQEKQRLRESIDERLARMSEKDRAAESRSVCRRIRQALPLEPGVIAGYVPMRQSEVDIQPLLEELIAEGWTVYLPVFEANKLAFRGAAPFTNLIPGPIGTQEPPLDAPPLKPEALQIALVPARAYDRKMNRMGRGNGGYDVWIRKQRLANSCTKFWGVCYECQLLNVVPMEPHDEVVDAVVTARAILQREDHEV
ncbi:MAG: ligase [Candidatus Peregrinibacteria bacterium Greene0416_19]|nr:MAG: ligase [Candidatus Peregrinibacteria bacterium Greene0416_19]